MPPDFFSILVSALVAAAMLFVIWRVHHPRLADSGWFWLFVFSGMGLLGVTVIGPKYDDRQKRLETRYDVRQRIAERGAKQLDKQQLDGHSSHGIPNFGGRKTNTAADRALSPEVAAAESETYGYPTARKVPLTLLCTILGLSTIVAGFMLIRAELPKRRMATKEPHA